MEDWDPVAHRQALNRHRTGLWVVPIAVWLLLPTWGELRSLTYVGAQCTIRRCEVTTERGAHPPVYLLDLRYDYAVASKPRQGTVYALGDPKWTDRKHADEIADRYRPGISARCWYALLSPNDAVLSKPQVKPDVLLPVGICAALVVGWLMSAIALAFPRSANRLGLRFESPQTTAIGRYLPELAVDRGDVHPFRLGARTTGQLGTGLFLLAMGTAFVGGVVAMWRQSGHLASDGAWMDPFVAFMVLATLFFGAIGLFLLFMALMALVHRSGSGTVEVELDTWPLYPGAAARWRLLRGGPFRWHSAKVSLSCVERVVYRPPGDKHLRAETCVLSERALADRSGLAPREVVEGELEIPVDAMHSFCATSNHIEWRLEVRCGIKWWPDWLTQFTLLVSPLPSRPEAEP